MLPNVFNPSQRRSDVTGKVVRLLTKDGGSVKSGQPYVKCEAMKMMMQIKAPQDGKVSHKLIAGSNLTTGDMITSLSLADPSRVVEIESFQGTFDIESGHSDQHPLHFLNLELKGFPNDADAFRALDFTSRLAELKVLIKSDTLESLCKLSKLALNVEFLSHFWSNVRGREDPQHGLSSADEKIRNTALKAYIRYVYRMHTISDVTIPAKYSTRLLELRVDELQVKARISYVVDGKKHLQPVHRVASSTSGDWFKSDAYAYFDDPDPVACEIKQFGTLEETKAGEIQFANTTATQSLINLLGSHHFSRACILSLVNFSSLLFLSFWSSLILVWIILTLLPFALPAWLERMRMKNLSKQEKLEREAGLKFRDGHGQQPRSRRDRGLLLLFVLTVAGIAGTEAACSGCAPGTSGPDAGPCDPCPLGTYKEVAGSHACSACPVDTYSTTEGAVSAAVCISCPPRSSTKGAAGNGSALSCECVTNAYPRVSSGPAECLPCPKGALCTGGECALQNMVNGLALCVGDADAILGQWSPGPEGMYDLISCPPGHQIVKANHDVQECKPCEPSTYIIDLLKPGQSCPLGAV